MKIATYNVNGVNGRLPVLLRWLEEARPDVVCLQELKAPDEKFPTTAIREAGYGAIWHGQKSWNGVAILARGAKPGRRGAACPAIPTTRTAATSRPIVDGITDRLPLPAQRQSRARAEVRLQAALVRAAARPRARAHPASGAPVVLGGRLQRHADRARRLQAGALGRRRLFRPEVRRELTAGCSPRAGPMRCARCIPDEKIYTFWDYFRNAFARNAGLRIDHLLLSPASPAGWSPPASTATCAAGRKPATTPRPGSNSQSQENAACRGRRNGKKRRGVSRTPFGSSAALVPHGRTIVGSG